MEIVSYGTMISKFQHWLQFGILSFLIREIHRELNSNHISGIILLDNFLKKIFWLYQNPQYIYD